MTAQDLARISSVFNWEQIPQQLRLQLLDAAGRGQWFVNLDSKVDPLTISHLKLLGFHVADVGSSFSDKQWCINWFPKE